MLVRGPAGETGRGSGHIWPVGNTASHLGGCGPEPVPAAVFTAISSPLPNVTPSVFTAGAVLRAATFGKGIAVSELLHKLVGAAVAGGLIGLAGWLGARRRQKQAARAAETARAQGSGGGTT